VASRSMLAKVSTLPVPKPMCSWKVLCPVGGYKTMLVELTKEICERFAPVDGLFYDICFLGDACGCKECRKGMAERGYDPTSYEDAKAYYIEKRRELLEELSSLVRGYHKDASVFFNGGADIAYPVYHEFQSHFELEDLPSVWGGYDRLPVRAKYFSQKYNKQTIAMTGKFHTSWGEFGGFKRPEALKYECANMVSMGAGCSVGDQLHPSGKIDMETYRLIGSAYDYIEKIEEYCVDMKEVASIGLALSFDCAENEGISKLLTEKKRGYVLVFEDTDVSASECIIVPCHANCGAALRRKIEDFHAQGGRLLLIGDAVRIFDGLGITSEGHSPFDVDYISDEAELTGLKSPLLCYTSAEIVRADGRYKKLAGIYEPYFSRTYGRYCSHRNTPNKTEVASYPAAVCGENTGYLAHDVPKMYYDYGCSYHRDYFYGVLSALVPKDVCEVEGLMSEGRMRLTENEKYYALHLFYASPVVKGNVCVIEDTPEIRNVKVTLRLRGKVKEIVKIPQETAVDFAENGGNEIVFTVDSVKNHQLIVIKK